VKARPPGRSEVRRLLEEHSLEPSRALGQNFVVDPNTLDRIVRLAGVVPGDRVLEIGAGLGSLTLALCEAGARVTALEIDRRLLPLLRDAVGDRAEIVEADALRADLGALLGAETTEGVLLVANLPYNIATPLVVRVLEELPQVRRLFVMVQREVGERFAAGPGNKDYGAVSVRIAYFATARIVGRVSPEVFHPRPHVESALVEITRREHPAVEAEVASYKEINRLLRAGFGTRRKMLRRSLLGLVDETAFNSAGVAPTDRAENLDVVAWGKLARWARSPMGSHTPN
jgi:16S rRNA (adenine1518-N6/adenine1519-N6)-dimethyltransferase